MLNVLRVFLYPSVSMQERHKLPKESGVYYLRLGTVKEIGSTSKESESSRQTTMKGIDYILESCPQESSISLNIQRLRSLTLPSTSRALTHKNASIGG